MAKINYSKVLTKEDCESITTEQYQIIIKDAKYHSNYLRRHFDQSNLIDFAHTRSREIAFLGLKYKNESNAFKELLATNIAYNDDSRLIGYLLSSGYDYDTLSSYASLIGKTKQVYFLIKRLGLKPNEDLFISNKKLASICLWFKRYFGFDDYNLALAKIIDLAVFKKELYLELQGKQITMTK